MGDTIEVVVDSYYKRGYLKGYVEGEVFVGGESSLFFLYRVDEDENGPGNTLVSLKGTGVEITEEIEREIILRVSDWVSNQS